MSRIIDRRRRHRTRTRQLTRRSILETLETRTLLGFVWGHNVDEVPLPLFPTFYPTVALSECESCKRSAPISPIALDPAPSSLPLATTRPVASTTEHPVRHFDGLPVLFTSDIQASASPYAYWGQTRSWSGLNNSGPAGNGWAINELPYIIVAGGTYGAAMPGQTSSSDGGIALEGTEEDERLVVVAGGTTIYTFSIAPHEEEEEECECEPPNPYASYEPWGPRSIQLTWTPDPHPVLRLADPQGNVTEFYDVRRETNDRPVFGSMAEDLPDKYGRFKSYTAANGTTRVEADYDIDGFLTNLLFTDTIAGDAGRLVYTYDTVTNDLVTAASATPPELLASLTLQRPDGSSGWTPVQRASYTYYTGRIDDGSSGWENDPHGRLGDLQQVEIEYAVGSGESLSWVNVDTAYYRYYKFTGESNEVPSKGPTNNAATTGGPDPIQPAFGTYDPNDPNPYDMLVFSGIKTVVEGPRSPAWPPPCRIT